MANLTRGHTFSSGDLVTATKLHNLVDSASVANIAEAALADGSHIITSSTTAPAAATAGHAWWDTSSPEADGYGILKIHDGTRWQSVAKNVEQYYFNRSGATLDYGDLVIFDTSEARSVTTTTSAGSAKVAGVIASGLDGSTEVGDDSEGRVVRSGLVMVKTTGTVTLGDYLGTSDTVKLAKSLGSSQVAGAFGIAVKDTGTLDQWLVALSGHTVDYVQKTTTDVLLQQNSTDPYCDNNSIPGSGGGFPAGGTIPGILWTGSYVASDTSSGSEAAAGDLMPLTWYDDSITTAGDRDVTVEGTVTVVANQMIHVELKDFALAIMDSGSNRTRCSGAGLAVRIIDNATSLIKSFKYWPGWQTHTQGFVDQATDGLIDGQVLPGMSTFLLENQTLGGITLQDFIWWKSLEHSFTADADGTYKVKVYWFVSRNGHNWNILNPNTTLASGTMGDLGMGKPTLKVVTR